MNVEQQNDGEMQKIAGMIKDVGVGMLSTPDSDGNLQSRPMQALKVDAEGSIWFFTDADSRPKEASARSSCLTFSDPSNGTFLSVSGPSKMLIDRALINELWSPLMKTWFPKGQDDPSLALLRIHIDHAEYWDAPRSAMVRVVALAASAVSGKQVGLGEKTSVQNR